MREQIKPLLKEKAKQVAEWFSNPERSKNFNNETFEVYKIIPTSDATADVIFKKNTGKLAVAFFYYKNSGEGVWDYFFPSDSHINGMKAFGRTKLFVEECNWSMEGDV